MQRGLRAGAVDNKEQVAAFLLGQDVIGGIVHRQMVRRHHDNGIFEVVGRLDFVDQRGDMLLAAGHCAQ
ncbi:hypothetical protein D3C84_1263410 [compost metagenome]